MTETVAQNEQTYLTQEAYERLQAELKQLTEVGRAEIADRIEAAREEGDLKENGGYHAAKEEQGKMEARIRQLTQLLDAAVVGGTARAGVVEAGSVVSVEMFGGEETFLLGSREILGDDGNLQVFSEKSPLGAAVLGHEEGDTVSYEAPNGKTVEVTVRKAVPYRS